MRTRKTRRCKRGGKTRILAQDVHALSELGFGEGEIEMMETIPMETIELTYYNTITQPEEQGGYGLAVPSNTVPENLLEEIRDAEELSDVIHTTVTKRAIAQQAFHNLFQVHGGKHARRKTHKRMRKTHKRHVKGHYKRF